MKKFKFINVFFLTALLIFTFSTIKAQDDETPPDATIQRNSRLRRPNLLSELNLNAAQIAEIRRLNREKRPAIRQAQQQLGAANRLLDQAVYSDNVVDADIQARIKEVQEAQAEVIKLRSASELAVRRLLTAAQLAKFRELRRQFTENPDTPANRRQNRRRNFPPRNFLKRGQ